MRFKITDGNSGKVAFRKRLLVFALAVVAPGILTAGLLVPGLLVPDAASASGGNGAGSSSVTDYVTFYGYVDNSPPSTTIDHPCIHNTAGGVGTYSNPITFAEPNDLNGPWCQKIYVPFLKKYFIHEDQCDPCGGVNSNHVDLWMGGDANSTSNPEQDALLNCESGSTQHNVVILNPPDNEPIDTTPLFTAPTTCHGANGDGGSGGS